MTPTNSDMKKEAIRAALLAIASARDGLLNPSDIVDAARDESSVLHDEFEWDDSAAAEAYRLAQAGALVRRVKLTVMRVDHSARQVRISTTREYQSRPSQRSKDGGYEPVVSIMSDEAKRAELLQQVMRELAAYRKRYAELSELRDVWSAVDDALVMFAPVKHDRPDEGDAVAPAA